MPRELPSLNGLAACLESLEMEARALGRPLAAVLIAAACDELRDPPAELAPQRLSVPASPRRG